MPSVSPWNAAANACCGLPPDCRPTEFALAVRRAAQTPFLAGAGDRGWRANFDWFIANDTNVRRVLEGCYDSNIAGIARTGGAEGASEGRRYRRRHRRSAGVAV